MTPRTSGITFVLIWSWISLIYSQNKIIETIDQAKQLYLEKNLSGSIDYLNQALKLVNNEILIRVESVFPQPLKGWRVESPFSRTAKTAYTTSLVSNCKYYEEGSGKSIEIEFQTNAPGIANIKRAFINPLMEPFKGAFEVSETEKSPLWNDFDFRIVSCGTDETRMEKNLSDIDINIGKGVSWRGGTMQGPGGGQKINLMKQYLSSVSDDCIIMFIDGYDTFIAATRQETLNRYLGFDKEIVFSAEKTCWPDTSIADPPWTRPAAESPSRGPALH